MLSFQDTRDMNKWTPTLLLSPPPFSTERWCSIVFLSLQRKISLERRDVCLWHSFSFLWSWKKKKTPDGEHFFLNHQNFRGKRRQEERKNFCFFTWWVVPSSHDGHLVSLMMDRGHGKRSRNLVFQRFPFFSLTTHSIKFQREKSLQVHKETAISQQQHLFSFRLKGMIMMSMKDCERDQLKRNRWWLTWRTTRTENRISVHFLRWRNQNQQIEKIFHTGHILMMMV